MHVDAAAGHGGRLDRAADAAAIAHAAALALLLDVLVDTAGHDEPVKRLHALVRAADRDGGHVIRRVQQVPVADEARKDELDGALHA